MTRRYLICPLVHPAAIVRGAWELEPAQVSYLQRVLRHLREGTEPTLTDVSQPPPGAKLYASVNDLYQLFGECRRLGAVSVDIENAGRWLICVGWTPVSLETGEVGAPVCLRIRLKGGGQFWRRDEDLREVVEVVGLLLGDPTVAKVFHNFLHDVTVLEDHGWPVAGRIVDTMTLAHLAYSEHPKGLQWTSTLYLGASYWKRLVKVDDEEEGKG